MVILSNVFSIYQVDTFLLVYMFPLLTYEHILYVDMLYNLNFFFSFGSVHHWVIIHMVLLGEQIGNLVFYSILFVSFLPLVLCCQTE